MKETYKRFILRYRRWLILLTHLFLIALAYYASFILRFDYNIPDLYLKVFFKTLPLLVIIKLVVFHYFELFQGLWRYVSIGDLWRIIKACIISSIIFILGEVFIFGLRDFPRSIFLNDFILCASFVGGIRFLTRLLREKYKNISLPKERPRILIVGAGDAGILTLKEYTNNPSLGEVIGFIDDDKRKKNETIHGIKILGNRNDIKKIAETHQVQEIILAMPSAKGQVIRDIVVACRLPGVKLKIVPAFTKIIGGELELKPREVSPEDLLGREPITIDAREIAKYLKSKKILITGAAGSIGSELCRQISKFDPSGIVLIDHNESSLYFLILELKAQFPNIAITPVVGDITDISLLKEIFSTHRPQVVFHAAAYKHVPLMEENPLAAVKNNALGSRNVIYAAHHYNAERFVLISTDKAVNPINVMGLTKRLAEIFLQAKAKNSKTKFMAVRFGNVLGSNGSVVPLFKKQIEAGGPVTITHPETTRYFMSITEAVLLVLQAGALGHGGEIFILDMGEQIRIVDLAKNLIALSGLELDKDIVIEYTGLRPGEKIKEELLHDKDKDKVTKYEKIFISPPNSFSLVLMRKQIRDLIKHVRAMDKKAVIKKMEEIAGKELLPAQS